MTEARHIHLPDDRLLTWFHNMVTDEVSTFRIQRDPVMGGMEPIGVDEGLELLAANFRQRTGVLLGPVREPARTAGEYQAAFRARQRRTSRRARAHAFRW